MRTLFTIATAATLLIVGMAPAYSGPQSSGAKKTGHFSTKVEKLKDCLVYSMSSGSTVRSKKSVNAPLRDTAFGVKCACQTRSGPQRCTGKHRLVRTERKVVYDMLMLALKEHRLVQMLLRGQKNSMQRVHHVSMQSRPVVKSKPKLSNCKVAGAGARDNMMRCRLTECDDRTESYTLLVRTKAIFDVCVAAGMANRRVGGFSTGLDKEDTLLDLSVEFK